MQQKQDKRLRHSKLATSGLSEQERKDKIKAYQQEYYQKVRRPKILSKDAARRRYLKGLTPEQKEQRRKEVAAAYYQRNKEKLRARDREYQKNRKYTPEQLAQKRKRAVEYSLKHRAKVREEKGAVKQWEKQASDNRKREEGKRLKTKEVDTSQLIPVKINAKTTVYARPGQDIEEIKARYSKPKAA